LRSLRWSSSNCKSMLNSLEWKGIEVISGEVPFCDWQFIENIFRNFETNLKLIVVIEI
jgi:hypothetical protein